MRVRLSLLAMAVALLAPRVAATQTFEHLALQIEGNVTVLDGGERPSVGSGGGPLMIGAISSAGISLRNRSCGLSVAPDVREDAFAAWTFSATPLRVKGDAVTFRLRWARSRDLGRNTGALSREEEHTLRPGQSALIDVIPVPPELTTPYACGMRSAILRAQVIYWPYPQNDSRLTLTEMWLIDDGKEAGRLEIRSQFNQPARFYFDTLRDDSTGLDFFGEITLVPAGTEWTVHVEVRSRLTEPGERPSTLLREGALVRARVVRHSLTYSPGSVAAVELPRLSENASGAFGGRTFSIRFRSRQIR